MKTARVIGNVISTVKHEAHEGLKLMIVQPVDCYGKPFGNELVAFDTACAGAGDYVLLIEEGGASRMLAGGDGLKPVDAVIVGVLDSLLVEND